MVKAIQELNEKSDKKIAELNDRINKLRGALDSANSKLSAK